jgi:hypothetical protein
MVKRGQGKGVKEGHGTLLVNRGQGKVFKRVRKQCWLIGVRERV